MSRIMHSYEDRGHDFYPTPREAVVSLLSIEREYMPVSVIEPACGDGAIVNPLREAGYNVTASDIVDRGCPDAVVSDFLSGHYEPSGAGVVTNPPFRLAQQFVDEALRISPYVAMLLRLPFLESTGRMDWFRTTPLARVHVSSRRLPMMHRGDWDGPKSTSTTCFCWFVWDKGFAGASKGPTLKWFDWKEYEECLTDSPFSSRTDFLSALTIGDANRSG